MSTARKFPNTPPVSRVPPLPTSDDRSRAQVSNPQPQTPNPNPQAQAPSADFRPEPTPKPQNPRPQISNLNLPLFPTAKPPRVALPPHRPTSHPSALLSSYGLKAGSDMPGDYSNPRASIAGPGAEAEGYIPGGTPKPVSPPWRSPSAPPQMTSASAVFDNAFLENARFDPATLAACPQAAPGGRGDQWHGEDSGGTGRDVAFEVTRRKRNPGSDFSERNTAGGGAEPAALPFL
jgi:hypothetical protein